MQHRLYRIIGDEMRMSPEYMADLHMFLISQDSDVETLRQRVAEHLKFIPRKNYIGIANVMSEK